MQQPQTSNANILYNLQHLSNKIIKMHSKTVQQSKYTYIKIINTYAVFIKLIINVPLNKCINKLIQKKEKRMDIDSKTDLDICSIVHKGWLKKPHSLKFVSKSYYMIKTHR